MSFDYVEKERAVPSWPHWRASVKLQATQTLRFPDDDQRPTTVVPASGRNARVSHPCQSIKPHTSLPFAPHSPIPLASWRARGRLRRHDSSLPRVPPSQPRGCLSQRARQWTTDRPTNRLLHRWKALVRCGEGTRRMSHFAAPTKYAIRPVSRLTCGVLSDLRN